MPEPAAGLHAWTVPGEAAGERLDRHAAGRLDVSRSRVQRWIDDGRARVDGRPAKSSLGLAGGERVELEVPEPAGDERVTPEEGLLPLLHADEHLLVVDKPAGLTVHPGAGRPRGTLVHRLLHHHPELAGVGGPGRPGIVHRLDKDTSGVMVVARTHDAHRRLAADFAARRVDKRYLAIVYGDPEAEGEVAAPIGRHPRERQRMAVRRGGRPATTRWRRLAGVGAIALLEVDILTGRTHQIRVHLKHAHHPLVGDPVYGESRWKGLPGRGQAALRDFPRPALHAWRITLPHPADGTPRTFEAPVPADLARLWEEASGHPFPALPPQEDAS
jgi:23S rRNA pseudouridine1911/1915/1917 synthase